MTTQKESIYTVPTFQIPYGKDHLTAQLPDHLDVEIIAPTDETPAANPREVVAAALDNLMGDVAWNDFAGASQVTIAVNDKTRPVPHQHLLPPLLKKLQEMGFAPEQITFVIATGLHAPMRTDEFPAVLPPEILTRYYVVSHDAKDAANLVALRTTARGTPVEVNRVFAEADLRIVVGNMEPHQFMGFSGGVKSAAIGLAGATTINHNHALMNDPHAALGEYEGNPARADVEEIGSLMGIHIALNAILNGQKQIVHVLGGDPRAVMQAGIPLVKQIFDVPVRAPVDLMIASPGGYPKDLNMYQAQKALAHAVRVTKSGGIVILVAACPEGTGSSSYVQWMRREDMVSHEAVLERFAAEGFKVGPHKAFQISRDASQVRVMLVSEMPPELARKLLFEPFDDLNSALSQALSALTPGARVGVMPAANATIPTLMESDAQSD